MTDTKITTNIKLPFLFNEEKLAEDLATVLEANWVPHFNTQDYEGDWKAIPLYAPGGDASNILALSTSNAPIAETTLLKACPYFKEVIDSFDCPILSARIMRLGVGAEIKPHSDYNLGYEDGCFRLHVPITTNPGVQFMLDKVQLTMLPGECWYTNVNYEHSVKNSGETDRVHLVIDGERNEWSDQLFFSLTSKESLLTKPVKTESPETIRRMIEELRRQDNPAIEPLIEQLEQQLNEG